LDVPLSRFLLPSETIKLWLVRLALSPVDRLITFSRSEYSFWEKYLGFSGRICYVPLGVDIDFFQPTEQTGDYIFSAGGAERDYPTLLSAFEQINVKLALLARGNVTKEVKLTENVELIPAVSDTRYRDLLSQAKFVVIPLKNVAATFGGTTILEAMAAGKAVVASRAGGAAEYIVDGETGILVQPGNVNELKQKIIFLLEHPEEAERIGKNARQAAEMKFNKQITVETIRRV
jgi:glycosyltransferase involved in cell wall biosynthesis